MAAPQATPTAGGVPLDVSFDGRASSDADGDPLTFDWNFGDGTAHGTGATTTHRYTAAGVYQATLVVSDNRGGTSAPVSVRIDVGNTAPVVTITAPSASAQFAVGQQITLTGQATDQQDGALPGSALSWRVIKHHSTHAHPFLPATAGSSVTITAPAPEDLGATTNSYLELELTATNSRGLQSVVTQTLQPHLVNITLTTSPAGLQLRANELTVRGPQTVVSWESFMLSVVAPGQQLGGQWYAFDRWGNGSRSAARTITTPATATTYTATFLPAAGLRWLPLVRR